MSSFIYFTLIISCVLQITLSTPADKNSGISPKLSLVGEYGGKKYWIDTNTRFQQAAAEYCRNQGFQPVQFDSLEEIDYLAPRLEPANYWTAGIDIGTSAQYHWVQALGLITNPVSVQVDDIVPFTGIYLNREFNKLMVEDIHTSMRPLCQEIIV